MTETNFSVVSNRTRDTEGLETETDLFSSLCSGLNAVLYSDSGTYYVSPASVLEAYRLDTLNYVICVNALFIAYCLSLFQR